MSEPAMTPLMDLNGISRRRIQDHTTSIHGGPDGESYGNHNLSIRISNDDELEGSFSFKSAAQKIFRKKTILNRFPIFKWLPEYKSEDLPADIIAGFSVGLTLVPQSIAYATVAGLPPQYGLYSAFIGLFVYLFLGSTKSLTLGPVALLSIAMYPFANKWGPQMAVFFCFMSGILELAIGVLNLGFLLDLISHTVVDGFCSAAAITIASTQLKALFGLKFESDGFLETIVQFFHNVHKTTLWDPIMGFASIAGLLLFRKLGQIKLPTTSATYRIIGKTFWYLSTARNAICVFICTGIAAAIYDPVTGKSPFKLIGNITAGIPPFIPPPFEITNQTTGELVLDFAGMCKEAGTSLIIIPLVAILEAVSIAKSFAKGQKVNANQEIIAIGIANILSSFFMSYPITGSFSRTAVNESSGVKSPLSGIVTGAIVLLASAFLTPYFFYIPKASLAAVIMTAVLLMIEYHVVLPMWRTKKSDLVPLAVTFIGGLLCGLEFGIIVGSAVHILILSLGSARPKIRTQFKEYKEQSYIIIQPRESLVFPSADHISTVIRKAIRNGPEIQCVLFDLTFVTKIDYATGKMILMLSDDFTKQELSVMATNMTKQVRHVLEALGPKNLSML